MKKKLSLILCVLLSICMLCACGEDPKTINYNGRSYDDLMGEAASNSFVVAFISQNLNGQELTADIKNQFLQQGATNAQLDTVAVWTELESTYGKCVQFEDLENVSLNSIVSDDTFSITKAGNTLTSDITLKFGSKDVIFEVVYDYYDMSVSSITINPVQTLGEKMKSAGQNTIISLAIVFFVLILISLIIKGFVIFPKIEEKKKNKAKAIEEAKAKTAPVAEAPVVTAPVNEQNLMDDLELVAVITAAIAASEGTSTSGFVVRSINRR